MPRRFAAVLKLAMLEPPRVHPLTMPQIIGICPRLRRNAPRGMPRPLRTRGKTASKNIGSVLLWRTSFRPWRRSVMHGQDGVRSIRPGARTWGLQQGVLDGSVAVATLWISSAPRTCFVAGRKSARAAAMSRSPAVGSCVGRCGAVLERQPPHEPLVTPFLRTW